MAKRLYNEFFNIDPRYFPQVTEALIKEGKVSWKNYFANESLLKILKQVVDMVNQTSSLSLFTWGEYGSGKSHLVLTLISMLNAPDEDVKEYFEDQKLDNDLLNKFLAMKNSGKIITIHRIGSANIVTETDLVLAVQQSIMAALEENGITNQGEASMKDSFIEYLSKPANRAYFNAIISEEEYAVEFAGMSADDVEKVITGEDLVSAESMMRKVMSVMKNIGQWGILKDADAMSDWIKDIIDKNNIKAIIFAWDEFSEFLSSHKNSLTGLQTLLEISNSHPFYFILVSHMYREFFAEDNKSARKFFDRFQRPLVEITLPENTAFKLLSQAMKVTKDPVLLPEWENKIKPSINDGLTEVRKIILETDRTKNKKSDFSDDVLQSVAPIHPYAALILRQIAQFFNSNQRSMFDFIINNSDELHGFKWFIANYGPMDDMNVLTVDLLWDFFAGKQVSGLSDDVRSIFLSYDGLKSEKLLPDEQKVLKTILILQAVSVKIANDNLLAPNTLTIELAFKGTDWVTGKAMNIVKGLIEKGLVFERPTANGKEYVVANGSVTPDSIEKYKEAARKETTTSSLIINANLLNAVTIPAKVKMRYMIETASDSGFKSAIDNHYKHNYREKFKTIITFAMFDDEAQKVRLNIQKNINLSTNECIYIECLTSLGKDLYDQYIDALAYSKYYENKDKSQARHYQSQAEGYLRQWCQNIQNGAFMVYTDENKNGERRANLGDLQDWLIKYDMSKYPCCPEQYTLNATLYGAFNLKQGAELGINQDSKSSYDKTVTNSLNEVINKPKYWEDSTIQSLIVVRMKKRIDEIITESFNTNNGEVSILTIYDEMEKPPFGFMPNSITSYLLGFCLKEYANSNYFWSNHSVTETMTVAKMRDLIANALAERTNSSNKYKDEYIVTMTASMREYLKGTAAVFGIPEDKCNTVEDSRDQMRLKMKSYQFPIWCVKYILDKEEYSCSKEMIESIIDDYSSIANTANGNKETEGTIAERIGCTFMENSELVNDLKNLITDSKCRDGMSAYIATNRGELVELATDISDGGAYVDEVKKKFNAGDGNWVWSKQTADEKISDVILEYKIVKESNKTLGNCRKLSETISEWNNRTNNIRIPCESVAKHVGDLGVFLYQLASVKRNNGIAEQDKQKFYDMLCSQRESFDAYYKDQIPYFKLAASSFVSDLNDEEIVEIYNNLPSGQFTKGVSEYYKFVQMEIEKYVQSQWKKKMQNLWSEKTNTKNPEEWSQKYLTPILCMIEENDRSNARRMFDIINRSSQTEEEAKSAIAFMETATFFDRLENSEERDRAFMKEVVGNNAVLLKDPKEIRDKLSAKSHDTPYHWIGSSEVKSILKAMVDKEYMLHGLDDAKKILENMDATQLREYLIKKINDNAEFGLQFLKGES